MSPFLLLSLVAGALAVDERAGWQSLLGQPIFSALLVGVITGQMYVALATGLVLELIWLSIMPMRGVKHPNRVTGGIVGGRHGGAHLPIHGRSAHGVCCFGRHLCRPACRRDRFAHSQPALPHQEPLPRSDRVQSGRDSLDDRGAHSQSSSWLGLVHFLRGGVAPCSRSCRWVTTSPSASRA